MDEEDVIELRDYVDGFGIGTSVSAAPVIDFCDKIVEITDEKGEPIFRAKRGDFAGKKMVYRNPKTFTDTVTLARTKRAGQVNLLKPLIRKGKIVRRFKSLEYLRHNTTKTVSAISSVEPAITWQNSFQ